MFSENYNLFCQLARQISALDTRAHFGKQINLKKACSARDRHPQRVETPTEYQTSQNREGSSNNHMVV
jgi:hypothetical protein